MQRLAFSLLLSATAASSACREPRIPAQPLPPLAQELEKPAANVINEAGHFVPGERMTWNVKWRGMGIGRAELAVGQPAQGTLAVVSRFRTRGVAESMRPIRLSLHTTVDATSRQPLRAHETLRAGGKTRKSAYHLQTKPRRSHTLQTALGVIRERARSRTNPTNGYLFVLFDGDRYRLDISAPGKHADGILLQSRAVRSTKTGAVDPDAEPISIDVVFSAAPTLAPIRVEIAASDGRIVAELIEHTGKL